jgi:uncharacterized membrane protein
MRLITLLAILTLLCLYSGAPLVLSLPTVILVELLRIFVSTPLKKKIPSRFSGTDCLVLLIAFYPLYIFLAQYQQWWAGDQGLDFGIFSQIVNQVATTNSFKTSLISTEWQNFFTHHFSPYLYLLGWISKLGVPSEISLIGAHALAAAALAIGIFKLISHICGSRSLAALVVTCVVISPSVRRAIIWETHDEVLALPFFIWSIYSFHIKAVPRALYLLLPPLLFKETSGLIVACISICYAYQDKLSRRKAIKIAVLALISSILLIYVLPNRMWVSTFDPGARLGSLSELLAKERIMDKAIWLLMVSLPALPFIAFGNKDNLRLVVLCIAPICYTLGTIALTNYEPLYNYKNYYALPAAVFLVLAAAIFASRQKGFVLAIALSLCLSITTGESVRLTRRVFSVFSNPSAHAEIASFIKPNSRVVVDDYSASVVASENYAVKVSHARRTRPEFNYIVLNKKHPQNVPEQITRLFVMCHETRSYQVGCRKKG